ncbi:DNA repair protein RadA [Patescibacteria group bacterium]|nr:MAG: DNA repair protein RadA [Patescibacteria group bacterium]
MKDGFKTIFICSNCDAQFTKWVGKCLECGKWGTIEKSQFPISNFQSNSKLQNPNTQNYPPVTTKRLSEIDSAEAKRIKTNIDELDRVLGGGLVPGSLVLLGGEPGIGKSTLAAQLAAAIPNTLYISGEESAEQIKLRFERLGIPGQARNDNNETLRFANATSVESVIAAMDSPVLSRGNDSKNETVGMTKPQLVIVDSIQTTRSDEVEGEAGSINQVRACAVKLMEAAKSTGVPIVLIGQVTKDGAVAGPKTLEHLVDTVLYLEGDRFHQFRILRAAKNRFGSTDEVGIFSMEENGLREVKNPSAAFLSGREENVPGSCVTCLMEGTRPLLIEVQALVTKTNFGYPQRRASGFDLNRLQVLIGVLTKRAGLPLDTYDVFLNVVGGISAEEPAVDLAVVLSIASATKNKQLPKGLAAFGEVGLGGEVRAVSQAKKRLDEIKKMGFEFAVVPASSEEYKAGGIKIAPVKNVKELVERIVL